jgi:hypothetical protein
MAKKTVKKTKTLVKKKTVVKKISSPPIKKKTPAPSKKKVTVKKSQITSTIPVPPILNLVASTKEVISSERKNKMIAEAAYYIAERHRLNPQMAAWLAAEKEIEKLLESNFKL